MINPVLSNFRIIFGDSFFPEAITKKYNVFLHYKKYPIKSFQGYFYETIQQTNMPGVNLSVLLVQALNNTGNGRNEFVHPTVNRNYPGTSNVNDVIEGVNINITFRNTILNWMYCYEMLHKYYKRKREVTDFEISLVMMDSAEIPMFRLKLSDCFISNMPGLEFGYNQSFIASKTFDIGFTFNKFDVEFLIPNFNLNEVTL